MNERDIFIAALQQPSREERDAFLNEACAGDSDLRVRVDSLFAEHSALGSFLQAPAAAAYSPTVSDGCITESPGTVIGPYKLLEQIGEGGFGVVFMAEQTSPVKRKVALKVIKPGMDTREVIARFEAERQALALMDHPNIAKVLDAGATETGRPFFVMELVRGVPITEYCDQAQLTPRDRLELFVTVCQAVQHAHQKGIIHRDIKPTNVLVAQHDDKPVVKVIDFGVAKATTGQLTDKTLFTAFAQVVGTPLYMSPEQAALSAIDIDTRSDIYSLGVLLYELLTGTTPFDKTRLQAAAFEEVRRIIREEEPQKPSTRLSSLGATLPSVSAVRRTEPRRLSQLVRGDLDWIVMKALEKDRTRRYESANGFASDVLRYLADEPVEACPPSAAYRFRKFARRNKGVLVTATIVTSALIVATIGLAISNVLVRAERNEKIQALADREVALQEKTTALGEREAALRQAQDNLAEARRQEELANENLARAEAGFADARRAVDEFLTKVTDSQLLEAPGLQPLRRDLLHSALAFYEEFLTERGDDTQLRAALAAVQYRVSRIYTELGDGRSRAAALEAKSLYEAILEEAPGDAEARAGLARCHRSLFEYEQAIAILTQLHQSEPANPQHRSELAEAYNSLALSIKDDNPEECLDWHRKAIEVRQALVDEAPDDPDFRRDLGGSLNNIGNTLLRQGHAQDALTMYLSAVEQQRAAFDRDPQGANNARYLLIGTQNVATTSWRMGDLEAAEQWHQKWIELAEQVAAGNPAVLYFQASLWSAYRSLSALLRFQGRFAEADASGQRAIGVLERLPNKTPEDLYQLACLRSRIVGGFDERGAELTTAEAAERDEMAATAVADLQAAGEGGATDWNRFLTDPNLQAIRGRADFQELVARLRTAEENAARIAAAKRADEEDRMRRESLRAQQELVDQDPRNPLLRDELAATKHAIGLGLIETPQRNEAETLLREALTMREALLAEAPGSVRYGLNLGQTCLALGEFHWSTSRFAEADAEFQRALTVMESALQSEPQDSSLWGELDQARTEVAIRFLDAGLWEESADLFAQASRRDASVLFPSQGHYWHVHAVLRLFVGDEAGFRNVCSAFHQRFKFADERFNLYRTAFAGPDALPRVSLLELSAAADRDVSRAAETGWYRLFPMMLNERLGEHVLALEQLDAIPPGSAGIDLEPIRAIVLHHLGRTDEARVELGAADELPDRWFRAELDQPLQSQPDRYPEVRLLFEVLRHEAHAEIDGRQDVDSPYRLLARARMLAVMGRTATANEAIAAALALRGNDAQVHVALATLLWGLDRLAEADAHWEQADKLLEGSLAQNSDDPTLLRINGRIRTWRGDWERAASAYDTLLDLLSVPDRRIDGLENWQVVHEISASNQLFDQLVAQRRYDWRLWDGGAEFQALSGQWPRAAEIAQMWTNSNPGDNLAWFLDSILQLYLQNIDGYRSSWRELMERFADGAEPYIAERIVKTCCLSPDENIDFNRVMDVATRAADEAVGANLTRSCQVARAMVEYRGGRYQAALDSFSEVLAQPRSDDWVGWCDGGAVLFQAMALHRLGRFDEAKQALDRARKLVAELYPEWTPGQVLLGRNWKDCVCYQITLREAEALLEVEPTNSLTKANQEPGQ